MQAAQELCKKFKSNKGCNDSKYQDYNLPVNPKVTATVWGGGIKVLKKCLKWVLKLEADDIYIHLSNIQMKLLFKNDIP